MASGQAPPWAQHEKDSLCLLVHSTHSTVQYILKHPFFSVYLHFHCPNSTETGTQRTKETGTVKSYITV